MRRLTSIVALLLLLTAAAPVLACMTDGAMSHEESACCSAMHGNCGNMAKMGCCRTEVQPDHPQIAVEAPSARIHWAVVAWLAPTLANVRSMAPPSSLAAPAEHSSPGLLTAEITVLRI